jgi:hypothetical protein
MTQSQSVYHEIILNEIWRLASLIDRNSYSPTRGSFSRTHWAWKFDDFPYPRMQEAIYALCRLHGLPGEDNPFYHSISVSTWIQWGLEYWISLQHKNGSFDEAYPFEQSLAATAFTTFYLGSAYLIWKERLSEELRTKLIKTFEQAGIWLCSHDETHGILSNHLAAAVAALEIMAHICDREDFSERARFFLERIFQNQSSEGWMMEYDGADIGYGTHSFFYLSVYWKMTVCEKTLDSLRRFSRFLIYFVHPDGTIGGEYASRNTEFYYPAGFEIMASEIPECASIAFSIREALKTRRVCGVWAMDTFNLFPMYNNIYFAMDAAVTLNPLDKMPWQSDPFEKYFPHCGVWIVNREHYYSIIGLSKGGTVSVFDKVSHCIAARHSGLLGQWSGKLYTSQDYTLSPSVVWGKNNQEVSFTIPWKKLNIPVFTPWSFISFRIFTLTFGRVAFVSRWIKNLLVKVLIRKKNRPPIEHNRNIHLTDTGVEITDHLRLPQGMKWLKALEQFTSIHMGSSLYCDIRSVGPSTGVKEFIRLKKDVSLKGFIGLEGSGWQDLSN